MKGILIIISALFFTTTLFSQAQIQWQRFMGGTYGDRAFCIKKTTDDGYIVAGWTGSNNGDVSGNQGCQDMWVVKIDQMGNIIWQKCFGGTAIETAYSIQQTIDGGYIVAGTTYSNNGDVSGNHGDVDMWVVKLNPQGSIQWQKCLGGTSIESANSN